MENLEREELIEELKKFLAEELAAYFQPVKNSIAEGLDENISPELRAKGKEWGQKVVHYVEEHPLQSVGLAVAAGFLMARFFYKGKKQ